MNDISLQKQKMLAGELYLASDPQLTAERAECRRLLQALNACPAHEPERLGQILQQLIPSAAKGLIIQPPFYCDYGYNIRTGEGVFMNFNCVILDVVQVVIGPGSLLGPNVQIYTATHPMKASERAGKLEYGRPVEIGRDVWIGGGAIICPGVRIGDGVVIGAGSVVTRDIPDGVFAAGNPARVTYAL